MGIVVRGLLKGHGPCSGMKDLRGGLWREQRTLMAELSVGGTEAGGVREEEPGRTGWRWWEPWPFLGEDGSVGGFCAREWPCLTGIFTGQAAAVGDGR